MFYVAALPHPKSSTMRKTTFVCYACNQTRTYALSDKMAKAYAASRGNLLSLPACLAGQISDPYLH